MKRNSSKLLGISGKILYKENNNHNMIELFILIPQPMIILKELKENLIKVWIIIMKNLMIMRLSIFRVMRKKYL